MRKILSIIAFVVIVIGFVFFLIKRYEVNTYPENEEIVESTPLCSPQEETKMPETFY